MPAPAFPRRAECAEECDHVAMLCACANLNPSAACIVPAVVPLGQAQVDEVPAVVPLGQAQVNGVRAPRPKLKDMDMEQRREYNRKRQKQLRAKKKAVRAQAQEAQMRAEMDAQMQDWWRGGAAEGVGAVDI